jgi:rRNA maturation protein Nop10
MRDIKYCIACRKHTMNEACDCTLATAPVFPPRYSPQDKYAIYRRKAKEAERKAAGTL